MTAYDREAWRAEALCARLAPDVVDDLFFGGEHYRYNRTDGATVEGARAVCESCPVLFECLAAVLAVPGYLDATGVVAGLLPHERATLRDDRGRRDDGERWIGGRPDHARDRFGAA